MKIENIVSASVNDLIVQLMDYNNDQATTSRLLDQGLLTPACDSGFVLCIGSPKNIAEPI